MKKKKKLNRFVDTVYEIKNEFCTRYGHCDECPLAHHTICMADVMAFEAEELFGKHETVSVSRDILSSVVTKIEYERTLLDNDYRMIELKKAIKGENEPGKDERGRD